MQYIIDNQPIGVQILAEEVTWLLLIMQTQIKNHIFSQVLDIKIKIFLVLIIVTIEHGNDSVGIQNLGNLGLNSGRYGK